MRFSVVLPLFLALLLAGCTSTSKSVDQPELVVIKAEPRSVVEAESPLGSPPTTSVVRVVQVFGPELPLGEAPVADGGKTSSVAPQTSVIALRDGVTFGVSGAIALAAILLAIWVWRMRSSPRLLRRAKEALSEGKYGLAAELAARACKRSSDDPNAWFLYGTALVRQGKYEQAVRDLGDVMGRLDPHVSGLAFLLAYSHLKQENLPAARPWLPLVARDETLWKGLGAETQFLLLKASGRPKKASSRDDPSYA